MQYHQYVTGSKRKAGSFSRRAKECRLSASSVMEVPNLSTTHHPTSVGQMRTIRVEAHPTYALERNQRMAGHRHPDTPRPFKERLTSEYGALSSHSIPRA